MDLTPGKKQATADYPARLRRNRRCNRGSHGWRGYYTQKQT